MLWDPPAAEKFVEVTAAKEAAFRELAKHHFPEMYKELRAPVQPTAQQVVQQSAIEQPSSVPAAPVGGVVQPQAPPTIPQNVSVPAVDAAQQIDQAPAPHSSPPVSAQVNTRSRPLVPGRSGVQRKSSYKGQPHSGARVAVSPTTRKYYDAKNLKRKQDREAKKQAEQRSGLTDSS